MHPSSRRRSSWLVWIGGVLAVLAMLILSAILRATENEGKAWPILTSVAQRLTTDEGARDLYRKNPRLAQLYDSQEAFVDSVKARRISFGTLPARQPMEARDNYEMDSNPRGIRASIKGSGGDWMLLEVERSDGTEAGHAAIGEGITFLGYADGSATAREVRRTIRMAYLEQEWSRFTKVEQALLTDEGTKALLQTNPELAPDDAARAAFLHQAQAWRPRLAASALPISWAKAPDGEVSLNRHSAPLVGESRQIGWKLKDGGWLRMVWKDGRIIRVSLGD